MRQITKPQARKIYNSGGVIALVPAKVNPESKLFGAIEISKASGKTFDIAVSAFEYYNCNNETGRYAHYFVQE